MHRSSTPPPRLIVMAAAVASAPIASDGWRVVSDTVTAAQTGYSLRTVRLAWQDLRAMGAAEVGRATDGDVRLIRPLAHPLWAATTALAEVSV